MAPIRPVRRGWKSRGEKGEGKGQLGRRRVRAIYARLRRRPWKRPERAAGSMHPRLTADEGSSKEEVEVSLLPCLRRRGAKARSAWLRVTHKGSFFIPELIADDTHRAVECLIDGHGSVQQVEDVNGDEDGLGHLGVASVERTLRVLVEETGENPKDEDLGL